METAFNEHNSVKIKWIMSSIIDNLNKTSPNKKIIMEKSKGHKLIGITNNKKKTTVTKLKNLNLNEKENMFQFVTEKNHYLPSYKEWQTSEYHYNNNNKKFSPVINKLLKDLIKSYFNLNLMKKNKRSSRIKIRFKRLSLNRIFVSDTEVKHTNNKAIITVYTYNRSKKFFYFKLKKLQNKTIKKGKKLQSKMSQGKGSQGKKIQKKKSQSKLLQKSFTIKGKKKQEYYLKTLKKNGLIKTKFLRIVRKNWFTNKKHGLIVLRAINKLKRMAIDTMPQPINNNYGDKKYGKCLFIQALNYKRKTLNLRYSNIYKKYIRKLYKKKILHLYYTKMLSANNNKFKSWFMLGIKGLISNIYKKETEINIVNLKYLHFNSNNFTEAIAVKLRNRDNRLLRVLKRAIKIVRLPYVYPLSYSQPQLGINTFPNIGTREEKSKIGIVSIVRDNLTQSILKVIKYKAVNGVRLEATGRLSRRLTASRSVFKYKYKGSLRDTNTNVDAKVLNINASSTVSRGHVKPNIQYTKLDSKTRNGAFGLKGWISNY